MEQVYRPGFRRRLAAAWGRTAGFCPRLSQWPSSVGPEVVVFDAEKVVSPCYRPIGSQDDWEAELGGGFQVLKRQGAWVVAEGHRLLWAPGFVANDAAPDAETTRAWIFEWK